MDYRDRPYPREVAEKLAEKLAASHAGIQAGNTCEVSRQPHWSELKEHERIERLRKVNKGLEARVNELYQLVNSLLQHRHDDGGNMCSPFNWGNHGYAQAKSDHEEGRNPDDVYF